MSPVALPALDRFRAVVEGRFGFAVDDTKLAELLSRRVEATGHTEEAYLDLLDGERLPERDSREELRSLAEALSVPESYFFRNLPQFVAFRRTVLPERLVARADARSLRILSAGCAAGEEPYSIAMVLRETLPAGWRCDIRAVDMSGTALEKARRGRFTDWSLRELSPEIRQRWFSSEGHEQALAEPLRSSVAFEERNLLEDDPALFAPESYDVVFLRNVIMYFAPAQARTLIARVERSLVPGGFLFLGHAETLRGLSQSFHLCQAQGAFFYQRRPAAWAGPPAAWDEEPAVPAAADPWLAAVVDESASWAEAIARSSEKVGRLAAGSRGEAAAASAPPRGLSGVPNLAGAVALLTSERFDDALDVLHAMPSSSARDPEVLLLRAAILTHQGRFDLAERACREVLAVDDLNAGARYLLALCRDGAGDREAAAKEDEAAAYLDPAFSMPRLHLGLLARRAGDMARARRELSQALALLPQEDASKLLLFGGGFRREALESLCRAELAACGARP